MGARGPQPQPTAILKLRQSTLVKRREKAGEPKPEAGKPKKPVMISESQESAWNGTLAELSKVPGLLTRVDGLQLERYARYLCRWREIEAELELASDQIGDMLLDKEQRQKVRLLWNESRAMDLHLKQVEEKFGLTPSARTRIRLLEKVADEAGANAEKAKDKGRFFKNHG